MYYGFVFVDPANELAKIVNFRFAYTTQSYINIDAIGIHLYSSSFWVYNCGSNLACPT